jgi:Na+/alanine symporter
MKALIKALNWLEWISAVIGVVLLLFALISIIVGHSIVGESIPSFFHAANSCFLLTIVLFLFIHLGQYKKE